jgi:hypothetical protein
MKTAIMRVVTLEFMCPTCKEPIESSTGSHLHVQAPEDVECFWCKQKLKVPLKAHRLLER